MFGVTQAIADYNSFMGGVDVSDQMIGYYNCLRPTRRYWKTLFFHFIDIAAINAWILCSKYREAHPAAIPRSRSYGHSDFVDALIRQLAGIPLNAEVPVTTLGRRSADSALAQRFNHQPDVGENLHDCKVYYQLTGQQKRTRVFCPDCKQNGKTPLCALWLAGRLETALPVGTLQSLTTSEANFFHNSNTDFKHKLTQFILGKV